MLTMRAAAALLEASGSVERLSEAVVATRLAAAPVTLDTATRDALGLMDAGDARIAAGVGTLRVLLVQLPEPPFRDALQRLARRLHNRAPHVLWLIAAVNAAGTQAAVVGWHGADAGLRVASFLWEPAHVVDSDAETLCALYAVRGDADVMIHAHCLDVLGREGLTKRFYSALESHVASLAASLRPADQSDARELALLCATRLLFIRFLEAKGWLNGEREFLLTQFERCMNEGGGFHRRVLLPLFFGTLNTPVANRAPRARGFGRIPFLNGGLFARTALERREPPSFADEDVGALLEHVLLRFRFTAREDSATWSEASIDPEMLGRAFESLMATGARRAGGVFYTPHALVERLSDCALEQFVANRDLAALREIRVLDPACGSGAFLVHVLERLAAIRRTAGETGSVSTIRRRVLARSVFGVDRNPTAVWLCELRLWLSVVIECDDEDPMAVAPLPNLDRNIRVGDALEGPAFAQHQFGAGAIANLRSRYVRATGVRKEALSRALDSLERKRALDQASRRVASAMHARRETLALIRTRDLFGQRAGPSSLLTQELRRLKEASRRLRREEQRLRDGGALEFAFPVHFADAHAAGGFDVVVGNPPWVRLHRIPVEFRERLKREYAVYRDAHWRAGALAAGAAPGFASQIDLAALFVERSLALLRAGGTAALLLPAKLWRSLAGGGVRSLLSTRSRVIHLADVADSPHGFGAVVYPSMLVAQAPSLQATGATTTAVSVRDRRGARTWSAELSALAFDASPGAPWLMLEPAARAAFDRVRAAGTPLSATFGPPRLGVKTGCNLAFLVTRQGGARGIATVIDAAGDTGSVEDALLRPALRGDAVQAFRCEGNGERIVWTHDTAGAPLADLPPRAAAWLKRHYKTLATRADAGSKRWWSLFRVDAADSRQTRLTWADFGRRPRAVVLEAGDPVVPLNTCYVLRCVDACDAWALAAVLNSSLASAWLNALAEPARGGFHRYLGWSVGQLPLPSAWRDVRAQLARAGRHASRSDGAAGASLDIAVMRAYGLQSDEVAALVVPGPCS